MTLSIIDRMETIIHNEMLHAGLYISDAIARPDLAEAGAICGGHHVCMMGALWLAAGVPIMYWTDPDDGETFAQLAGVGYEERENFLADRPEHRAAYDALNEAATAPEWAARDRGRAGSFPAPAEALFEGRSMSPADLLRLCDAARAILSAQKNPGRES